MAFSFSFLFFFFALKLEIPSQPKNVHTRLPGRVRVKPLATAPGGTVISSFRTQLHDAELLLFLSVECCTDVTVILYYLAHCRDVI